jgi:hypothetical protein
MKQIWPTYAYSPTTNVLTLTGLNIDRDQLLLVTAADRGRIMYNFADSSVIASAFTSGANTALTLVATTAGLTTTAALVIYYDDQLASTTVTVSSLPAISGTVTAMAGTNFRTAIQDGILDYVSSENFPVNIGSPLPDGTNRIGVVTIGGGTVTIGAGTAQIGSVTASISGTVPISISSVTVGNSVTIGSALPAGTNRIGVVTIGAGTVTIGAGTAQIGSVTASLSNDSTVDLIGQLSSVYGVRGLVIAAGNESDIAAPLKMDGNRNLKVVVNAGSVTIGSALPAGTNRIGVVTIGAGTVTIGAGTAQIGSVTVGNSVTIGSLPAISGTVTANLSISSTAITSGSFTSLTSATLVPANPARKMATVFNLGAGQLFINAGVTATTLGGGFMVALSSGDFYECDYTTTTLSAIFATAGTASWMSH